MPRFGISSLGLSSPLAASSSSPAPPLASPAASGTPSSSQALVAARRINSNDYAGILDLPGNSNHVTGGPSVRLLCSSAGAMYSLQNNDGLYYLTKDTLPLNNNNDNDSNAAPIQALLPESVQLALQISPPVELFSFGSSAETQRSSSKKKGNDAANHTTPALLCLYTRRNVFYLELTTPNSSGEGDVSVSAQPALEHYFLHSAGDDVTIVRIQPAPQRHTDLSFATLCPKGAMAMLTHNPTSNEYALVVQHSLHPEEEIVSVPLSFSLEESYEADDSITDFCFAQSGETGDNSSGGLSLLSTLTVLLLKGNATVYTASPIVFDGSVVHKSCVTHALDLVDYHISTYGPTTAKGKRARAARAFLQDAFSSSDNNNRNNFVTARLFGTSTTNKRSLLWPVSLQGPLFGSESSSSSSEDDTMRNRLAVTVENFAAADLVGIAIGRQGYAMELGMVSPSSLLPRFRLENYQDAAELNESLAQAGVIVEKVLLCDDDQDVPSTAIPLRATTTNQSLALVRDPIMDSMLHYVTPTGVTTLSTNSLRVAVQKIQSHAANSVTTTKDLTARTAAWSSVNTPSATVQGAVIGNDPRLGHALFVRLKDGSLVPINVTESRYLHELEHLIQPSSTSTEDESAGSSDNNNDNSNTPAAKAANELLEDMPPFYTVVDPMLKKISTGLANMGKIVGSHTPAKEVTPEMLAVALSVKEQTDNGVVMPLYELKQTVRARRQVLKQWLVNQMKELSALKKTIQVLQDRMSGIEEKARTAQENSQQLAIRSDAVLQASQDLMPSLTQAEYVYFEQLKRLKVQLASLERAYGEMTRNISNLRTKMDNGEFVCNIVLADSMRDHADALLDGQEKIMAGSEATLNASESRVSMLAVEVGGKK